ncbi:MAG: Gfo/Idh/MocA family oxidoreductase [Lentisphaerae bacterium]|nr:Gfo/Idh/MocA family oxidoreductase [Lentisphaerota bacterium]
MNGNKTKIGIVGCGNISDIYFNNFCNLFNNVEIKSCADIVMERAQTKAMNYGIYAVTVAELMADPEIEIIVNLTVPQAHYEVSMNAIKAGKNVYSEKPIALTRKEGKALLSMARKKHVMIGNAPDTFMGAGIQTCVKLINDGAIGDPIAATAFMMNHGHEHWHPNAEFYYKFGGGPMFDMGPYYLTALIALLGPVKRITGATKISFTERIYCGDNEKKGQKIKVDIPTHVAGIMDFKNGVVGTIITSFDVWSHHLPSIEIYGTNGSLQVPNPNEFGGTVSLFKSNDEGWRNVPLTHAYEQNSRGIGVADMAKALTDKYAIRASGEMAYHVLDLMHAFHDASDKNRHIEIQSTCKRPKPM